jgi:protein gp37
VESAVICLRHSGCRQIVSGTDCAVCPNVISSEPGCMKLTVGQKRIAGRGQGALADHSRIEWTSATWNPTTGCDRVSAGCDNCYALALAARLKAMGAPKYRKDGDPRTSGPGFGVTMHPGALELPLRWRAPRLVFVNSMSDLFHARVDSEFVGRVWEVMARTPQHTYQILTKRPERLSRVLDAVQGELRLDRWPLPNVWLGTSVESNDRARRADDLRAAPAITRFLSLEPLLGSLPSLDLTGIDWVIVGGESGPRCRPMDPEWVRDLRDRSTSQGVPFFFKQWGGRTPKAGGRELDGRTWDEFPTPGALDRVGSN